MQLLYPKRLQESYTAIRCTPARAEIYYILKGKSPKLKKERWQLNYDYIDLFMDFTDDIRSLYI